MLGASQQDRVATGHWRNCMMQVPGMKVKAWPLDTMAANCCAPSKSKWLLRAFCHKLAKVSIALICLGLLCLLGWCHAEAKLGCPGRGGVSHPTSSFSLSATRASCATRGSVRGLDLLLFIRRA
eukprot:3776785-Amphidinium_carterae.2